MRNFIDLTGKRFGRLTVIRRVEDYISPKGYHLIQWLCKCDCGKESIVMGCCLTSGNTMSCGCLRKEEIVKKNKENKTHGISAKNQRFYNIWRHMIKRCEDSRNKDYKNYGARGVSVCERWHDIGKFYEDMYSSYIKHVKDFGENDTTIERIDVNGVYEKGNVRWATQKEQARNMRTNYFITFNNNTKCLSEWCEEFGFKYSTIYSRIKRGWSIERAFFLE